MIKKIIFLYISAIVYAGVGHASIPLHVATQPPTQKKPIIVDDETGNLIKLDIPINQPTVIPAQQRPNPQPIVPILAKSESENFDLNNQSLNNQAIMPGQVNENKINIEQKNIPLKNNFESNNFSHITSTNEDNAVEDANMVSGFKETVEKMQKQYSQLLAEPTEYVLKKAGEGKISTQEFIRRMFMWRYTKKTTQLITKLHQKNITLTNPDDIWNAIIEKAHKKQQIKAYNAVIKEFNPEIVDETCCSLQ